MLYPADSYTDRLVFTPASTADNKAYYAYYTHVQNALYNSSLKCRAPISAKQALMPRWARHG